MIGEEEDLVELRAKIRQAAGAPQQPARSQTPVSAPGPRRAPAMQSDFVAGHSIFVRGQPAVVEQVDWPLVYYGYSSPAKKRHCNFAEQADDFFQGACQRACVPAFLLAGAFGRLRLWRCWCFLPSPPPLLRTHQQCCINLAPHLC